MTYVERQRAWIKEHDIKEGTELLVTRAAQTHEEGWQNSWTIEMGSYVGKIVTFRRLSDPEQFGIRLKGINSGWPFFVFEVVYKKPEIESDTELSISLSEQ